jgi:hypothetical protein
MGQMGIENFHMTSSKCQASALAPFLSKAHATSSAPSTSPSIEPLFDVLLHEHGIQTYNSKGKDSANHN